MRLPPPYSAARSQLNAHGIGPPGGPFLQWLSSARAGMAPPLATLPAERTGISGQVLAKVDLPGDFPLGSGRQLRMRRVTIEPGGFLPLHSHADRPAVAYVLQGTLTEYLEGEAEPIV